MKPILVTGATGFLGRHLVELLKPRDPILSPDHLSRDQRERMRGGVRLLCRGASPWDSDPLVEVVRGDIVDREAVTRAMQGVGQVYHLAGMVSREPRDAGRLYQVHVEGTRALCEAALVHRPDKMVMVSSSGTIAVGPAPVAYDENSGYTNEVVGEWPYYLSKIFAEKLALWYAAQQKLPIVVVNPSLLLGPGDDRGSSTGDVELFLAGQILAVPLGGLNFIDARDAAAGLVAAMERGRIGERYLLGGPNWTFRELIEAVARVAGRRAPSMQLPVGAALWGARLLRATYPLAGKTYRLDDASVRMSALFWYCDNSKARAELGFTTREPMETLRETVEDLRRRKHL